jgi:hypothetical protein
MTAPMKIKKCKDCAADDRIQIKTARPAIYPGPRCATHWRKEKKRRRADAHAAMIAKNYSITREQYAALYAFQGGKCALCQVATGKVKRLAVDHDHKTGLVRGLLCGPCNKDVIGRLGREALQRGVEYLDNPPGRILVQPIPTTMDMREEPLYGSDEYAEQAEQFEEEPELIYTDSDRNFDTWAGMGGG